MLFWTFRMYSLSDVSPGTWKPLHRRDLHVLKIVDLHPGYWVKVSTKSNCFVCQPPIIAIYKEADGLLAIISLGHVSPSNWRPLSNTSIKIEMSFPPVSVSQVGILCLHFICQHTVGTSLSRTYAGVPNGCQWIEFGKAWVRVNLSHGDCLKLRLGVSFWREHAILNTYGQRLGEIVSGHLLFACMSMHHAWSWRSLIGSLVRGICGIGLFYGL